MLEIIAEIGINHDGSVDKAAEMINAARSAGATTVKFQMYHVDELMVPGAPIAEYMTGDSFNQIANKYALTVEEMDYLMSVAHQKQMKFLASPFDVQSVADLVALGVNRIKIPSGELTNPLMLEACAMTRLPLIVSTGMATMEEVCSSVDYLSAQQSGPLTLLHCTSAYPARPEDLNLRVIRTMQQLFSCPIGYSDHSLGSDAAIAAAALGATVIEKHFTTGGEGPDHVASMKPEAFLEMVNSLMGVDKMLGNGIKIPAESEADTSRVAKKSIVAKKNMVGGMILKREHLTTKRPCTGIPASELSRVVGQRLTHTIFKDHILTEEDIECTSLFQRLRDRILGV